MGSFFDQGFMPHIHCYLGKPSLVWTMVVTDSMIGFAYLAISITLWRLIHRIHLPFSFVVVCFGVFIGACGTGHFIDVWTLWHPDYWFSAAVKIVTAIASVGTGIYLYRLRHAIYALSEAARESAQRKLDLEQAARDLEHRVKERTLSLRESEAKFRTITDAMPQMVWSSNAAGRFDYFNQRWYDFTGAKEDWSRRDPWSALIHADDLPMVTERWAERRSSGTPLEVEYRLRTEMGEYRWVLARALPLKNDEGRITRWMGTCTDIHDHRVTQDTLSAAVQARDEFLSIASHELKTPLTSLKLQSQLAQREIERDIDAVYDRENVKFMVAQTEKQVGRLTRLVDDMLDIARIRSGKLTLEREETDLCEVIGDVIERLTPQFCAEGYAVPAAPHAAAAIGRWDRLRVEQVVTNLLTNAIRYGEGRPVSIDVHVADRGVSFDVVDHGIGIDPSVRERIFDRFERAVDANEVSGLGLGLFITRQIVGAHAGRIDVVSRLGQGSKFEVYLPRDGGIEA